MREYWLKVRLSIQRRHWDLERISFFKDGCLIQVDEVLEQLQMGEIDCGLEKDYHENRKCKS